MDDHAAIHTSASHPSGASGCQGGRFAFFGGSFDPPHLGHLAIARAARSALRLDRVLFTPVGAQPLKPNGSTASFSDRLAMTELAIAGEPGFEVSLADAPNAAGEPNYTLETLHKLRTELPANGCLYCLMGADSFASLRRWHRAADIPFTASLVVASRPGQDLSYLASFLPKGLTLDSPIGDSAVLNRTNSASPSNVPIELRSYLIRNETGETVPIYLLPGLDIEISASEIRAQVRSSPHSTAPLSLHPAVAEYIRGHGLYR